ncbi:MAG: hypothetical protein IPH69_10220 [Bacteroidales bacterium]|nr:hypothetical protein [Bacteroidales bacterium]
MKNTYLSIITILSIILITGCNGSGNSKKNASAETDTTTVADTGFTGITQGMSGQYIVNETTYKNGVRHGLKKTFYQSGKVRQTFWYENGLRQDSSRWYFEEGQLFRTTPYKNDTIDGIQKQFYRTGKLKAKIGYEKGLRTTFFQEFTAEGKLVGGYPELIVGTTDNYKTNGTFRITLKLSDKSEKVRFFRGELYSGVFDTSRCERIKTVKGIGYLDLKKSASAKSEYVGIIAEILTGFGNNYLVYKRIDLPYNDLK